MIASSSTRQDHYVIGGEKACRMQLAAAGGNLSWSSDEEALEKRGRMYGQNQLTPAWQYMLRRLQ